MAGGGTASVRGLEQRGVFGVLGAKKEGGFWCKMRLDKQAVEKLHRPLQVML